MSLWRVKAAVQHLVAYLPYKYQCYGLVQTYLTGTLKINRGVVEKKLRVARRHWNDFQTSNPAPELPPAILEIGTGWIPVIPLGLYLAGAGTIHTFDIAPLLKWKRVKLAIEWLLKLADEGKLHEILGRVSESRLEALRKLAALPGSAPCSEVLRDLGIITLVGKESLTRLPNAGIDLIVSHEVLEYVPREDLPGLFGHFDRLASSRCVMSHYIDLRDEYSYFDRAISPLNFLRFSEQEWKRKANPLFPTNRLRLPEYEQLFAAHGFVIEHVESRSAPPDALAGFELNEQFRHLSEADLLVLNFWIRGSRSEQ